MKEELNDKLKEQDEFIPTSIHIRKENLELIDEWYKKLGYSSRSTFLVNTAIEKILEQKNQHKRG